MEPDDVSDSTDSSRQGAMLEIKILNMDDLVAKHRKEKKELQGNYYGLLLLWFVVSRL